MSGEGSYVIASYAITWAVLVGYGVYLWAGSKAAASQRETKNRNGQ
jgi:hypothetical protein